MTEKARSGHGNAAIHTEWRLDQDTGNAAIYRVKARSGRWECSNPHVKGEADCRADKARTILKDRTRGLRLGWKRDLY